jgi:hypothetical protein
MSNIPIIGEQEQNREMQIQLHLERVYTNLFISLVNTVAGVKLSKDKPCSVIRADQIAAEAKMLAGISMRALTGFDLTNPTETDNSGVVDDKLADN